MRKHEENERRYKNNIGEAFGDVGRPGRPFGKLFHIIFIFTALHSQIEYVT